MVHLITSTVGVCDLHFKVTGVHYVLNLCIIMLLLEEDIYLFLNKKCYIWILLLPVSQCGVEVEASSYISTFLYVTLFTHLFKLVERVAIVILPGSKLIELGLARLWVILKIAMRWWAGWRLFQRPHAHEEILEFLCLVALNLHQRLQLVQYRRLGCFHGNRCTGGPGPVAWDRWPQ